MITKTNIWFNAPVIAIAWLLATAYFFWQMMAYDNTAGPHGVAPQNMEGRKPSNKHLLIVMLHPYCACSYATLDKVSKLLSRYREKIEARIYFINPSGVKESPLNSSLYKRALELTGAETQIDNAGTTTKLFGGKTSGHVLLYSPKGILRFSGGLTNGRGEYGDSSGEKSISNIIDSEVADNCIQKTLTKPVFGCLLQNKETKRPCP